MYPYIRYNDEADAEAHARAFLTTWEANHVSQCLAVANANASKIAEFGLSLNGQSTIWCYQVRQHNAEYLTVMYSTQGNYGIADIRSRSLMESCTAWRIGSKA